MKSQQATHQKPARRKAVIFTHFGGLQYGKTEEEWLNSRNDHLKRYTDIFKSYLRCAQEGKQLSLVYVYLDWAIRQTLPKVSREAFLIDPRDLAQETELAALLEVAEERARKQLDLNREHPPRFRHVGLYQLVNLLIKVAEINRDLVRLLGGLGGILFTYDSPKFAEAVIRLARGGHPPLANDPIVRIDEDAVPTAGFLRRLLEQYAESTEHSNFFFFSGTYGSDGKDKKYDPINDHAVRTHWLANNPPLPPPVQLTTEQTQKARIFLATLGKIGAVQFPETVQGRQRSPQVISGAGLIMSHAAISLFPPFMNFEHLTVWVDDHLKRRLHEAVGDIERGAPESLPDAKIQQDRHPTGLTEKDMEWAKTVYFDRLLRGCLFDYLITEREGRYATVLKRIAHLHDRSPLDSAKEDQLRCDLMKLAKTRYAEAKECWKTQLAGTLLYDWIVSASPEHCTNTCNAVVKDALEYVHLLIQWPVFTRAIQRLQVPDNYWLFLRAD